jgi:hypothetical protein
MIGAWNLKLGLVILFLYLGTIFLVISSCFL